MAYSYVDIISGRHSGRSGITIGKVKNFPEWHIVVLNYGLDNEIKVELQLNVHFKYRPYRNYINGL